MAEQEIDVSVLVGELRAHMEEEGELAAGAANQAALDGEFVFEQKMKLTGKAGATSMFVVPSQQDWVHDALDEVCIVAGTLYAEDEPFLAGAAAVGGYFQADDSQRWVRVRDGAAPVVPGTNDVAWVDDLADFPEVAAQYQACMQVPKYRHAAEQVAMKCLVTS